MNWQVASFVILAAVLVAGFAWYERSRPPSQIVALVAALAALAVAGRILIAPIPNVVATTDIVLISGYALGPAPGFVVGALSAVISNFWLGQGPWTPWQMAAWGLCGAGGAALAVLTARRIGRVGLALACGCAGILFGMLMNFSLMASYGGEMSVERFLALEARAVPFDVAHAAGNMTLALVAGPALIRMLTRFRDRFEWRRLPGPPVLRRAGLASVLALVLGASLAPASASAAPEDAAGWLAGAQNDDGGFGTAPDEQSSVEMTGWVMLGLEAADRNPLDVSTGDPTPIDYLRNNAEEINTTGDLERTILALAGAGVDPANFGGRNLVKELRARDGRHGAFSEQVNLTAFGVLALRAADQQRGFGKALAWLRGAQNPDGGWGFTEGAPSDPDSTGAALQAILGSRSARQGVNYLRAHQRRSGGWGLASGGPSNSQSTAWAMQGLLAGEVDPDSVRAGGRSGPDYLANHQADDGHYTYSSDSDQTPVWVTGQALVPMFDDTFPLAEVAREPNEPDDEEKDNDEDSSTPDSSGSVGQFDPVVPFVGGAGSSTGLGNGDGDDKSGSISPISPAIGGSGAPEAESPAEAGGDKKGEASGAGFSQTQEQIAVGRGELSGDERDPLPPVGIGVGTTLAVIGGVWLLGRRREW